MPEANCLILGETHAEIKALVVTVMETAKQYGDENVLCIFDENLDNYKEGEYTHGRTTKLALTLPSPFR